MTSLRFALLLACLFLPAPVSADDVKSHRDALGALMKQAGDAEAAKQLEATEPPEVTQSDNAAPVADDGLNSHRNALSDLMKKAGAKGTAQQLEATKPAPVTSTQSATPAAVAEDIVKTHGEAARETSKLLADPLNYKEEGNPDSEAIAAAAAVDDTIGEVIEVPDVNYAEFLTSKEIRKLKKFSDKRIAIPVYRVAFCIQTKASAQAMAGLDRNRGGANASMTVSLAGIDRTVMEAITDRAYRDYLTRLEENGFDVVPFEEIQASEGYQATDFVDGPYSKNMFGTAFTIATPKGMPLFWEAGNPMGNKLFGIGQSLNKMSSELNATVVLPTLVINFAEMSSSGRSFFARTAEVGAEMGITLNNMTGQHLRIGHPKVSTAVVFMGNTRLQDPVSIAGNFGQMVEGGGGYDDRALVSLLSSGMGTALSSSVRETRIVKAEPRAYQQLSLQALATGNTMFAKAMADARDGVKPTKKKKKR